MLLYAAIKTHVARPPPKIVSIRNFRNFDPTEFQHDIVTAPWSVCSAFEDPDDCYWAWCKLFGDICDKTRPLLATSKLRRGLGRVKPRRGFWDCFVGRKHFKMASELSEILSEPRSKNDEVQLEEIDIPGAVLLKPPEQCTIVILKRWLACRAAKVSGKRGALIQRFVIWVF